MANTYDFSGRVALVTGGASGIGAATAARLREGGARVAIFDRAVVAVEPSLLDDLANVANERNSVWDSLQKPPSG